MQPFVLNRHGRLVFPSNLVPELDLATIESAEQLGRVVRRDFEMRSPTGTDILARVEAGRYPTRYELMRDLALNLFWANRFAITLYEKRPVRWADVPRSRPDVFLPVLTPWVDADVKVAAVRRAYEALPARWDEAVEDDIFRVLFDVFGHRRHHATTLPAVKPTVAEALATPGALTYRLRDYDPDFPVYDLTDIVDCSQDVPELEALHRWAMVLHNQYPWDREKAELVEVASLRDDDHVVVFVPRTREVRAFLRRVAAPPPPAPPAPPAPTPVAPARPYPALDGAGLRVPPRLEALAVVHGELVCSNDDLIRNSAYSWSPMSAAEIRDKTGIEQRRYSTLSLEELALQAARAALAKAQRGPEEIGAVIVCTCTSSRLVPSAATYLSGRLGIAQTYASYDLIAACAGMPYGLAAAARLIQEIERPVLVVCVEKFSDKIGNVRPSRMIFGDGAAAMVLGVAPPGQPSDLITIKTYASGPVDQVESIVWPNPLFDGNLTLAGPQVKALAGRYLAQMIDELGALPDPDGGGRSLLESIELIVPHQANKTMVTSLAERAGLSADQLYFNIEQVGNTSSASIPLAIHDAVRDGVISRPVRLFAPGFGAGAVAGYTVMRLDPAVVAVQGDPAPASVPAAAPARAAGSTSTASDDVQQAFG